MITNYFTTKPPAHGQPSVPPAPAKPPAPTAPTKPPKLPAEHKPPKPPTEAKPRKKAKPLEIDEQDFIDFFCNVAKHPNRSSGKMMSRKVAVFGKPYCWGSDVTFSIAMLPSSFRMWCSNQNLIDYNSVSVNIYLEKKNCIGWHSDSTQQLADGEIVSLSFAKRKSDRTKPLGQIEFRWKQKKTGQEIVKREKLRHESILRFDAIKHMRRGAEHRVANSPVPRVNITLRKLK